MIGDSSIISSISQETSAATSEQPSVAPTAAPAFCSPLTNPFSFGGYHSEIALNPAMKFPGSPIRLEIWNISPLKIRLQKGMPICQIIFEEVHGIPEGRYAGQFAIQGPS